MNNEAIAALFRQVCQSFGESLLRAMRVSGENADGDPCKVTQDDLAKKSGLARSTIAKYAAIGTANNVSANPNLKELCGLAHALNVPPAMLLMRADDWKRLAHAVTFIANAAFNEKVKSLLSELNATNGGDTAATALAGIELAKRLYPESFVTRGDGMRTVRATPLEVEMENLQARFRLGVRTTSVLPPLRQLKSEHFAPLLSICAHLGATTNL